MMMKEKWLVAIIFIFSISLLSATNFRDIDSTRAEKNMLYLGFLPDLNKTDEPSPWVFNAQSRLNLNQVSFTNWAEGGQSTITTNTIGNFKAGYLKKDFKIDNFLNMAYGITWNEEQGIRKSDDKIDLGTSLGYKAFDNWFYTLVTSLKTQFSAGYKYPNDSILVSNFLAPATMIISMGLEYKPDKNTSVFISPSSGKFVFVTDQNLADKGAYGVDPALRDTSGAIIRPGANYRSDFGINLIVSLNRDIVEHVNLDSKLNLHNNYMDQQLSNRWNFDVDWETAFNFKINSFLSSILYIHFLYDDDTAVPTYKQVEGQKLQTGEAPKLQIKQNFGVGVTLKI